MRNITNESINAFLSETNFKKGNMSVIVKDLVMELRLYDNTIAYYTRIGRRAYIQTCGWFTNTTKERLNGLPNVRIKAIKGVWHLNGETCNGQLKEISLRL